MSIKNQNLENDRPEDIQHAVEDLEIQRLRTVTRCRVCGKEFRVNVPRNQLEKAECYPFMHLILHGNPLHAHAVYIDRHGAIRGAQSSTSMQIDRTSATFQQLVIWWSMHS
ncbi:MAG: hypothetical protein ACTSRA_19605 [Promethearchaeota archaeon]